MAIRSYFTLKIILGYLVLGVIAAIVGWFLFTEIKNYSESGKPEPEEKKLIKTGTLINLLYKSDGISRLALLSEDDKDFDDYIQGNDSLYHKIDEIKALTTNDFQKKQLDSIKILLEEKNKNIEQLRILRLTNQKETSLDDIMKEVRKLEASVGLASVESMVREPHKLTRNERRIWQSYANYLNSSRSRDTSMVKSKVVDSMLTASRYIVAEAKKENSRIRKNLNQKENELILNDLNISERLRQIITSFDTEITKNATVQAEAKEEAIKKTGHILRFAAVLGGLVILLFSYFILSDFFEAERYKKNLEISKNYAENLLKSRDRLISTVSHDLNTPLNSISGYSQLLLSTNPTKKQSEYVRQISSSVDFISGLINDLLDFSKLAAGKITIEYIPFSLDRLIEETAIGVKQGFANSKANLEIKIDHQLKNRIFKSDPLRLRQILNNLLSNAFKFTKEGTVRISATVLDYRGDEYLTEIRVKDTGIGISKEKQKVIFEEFTQAESDTSSKFGGSGLGLAISLQMANLLQGDIRVESVLGEGSEFILNLPLIKTDHVIHTPQEEEKIQIDQNLNAVVIDDDKTMGKLLEELLKNIGITAFVYENYYDFEEAIEKDDFNFNFLLTDIQMKEVNGFMILKNLKEGRIKNYNNQPVIAMTGSHEHNREHFLEKGFFEVLRKPFTNQQLLEVLNRISFIEEVPVPEDTVVSTANRGKTFNLNLLASFLDSEEALEEILNALTLQTETDVQTLEEAIEQQDISAVTALTHRMLTMFKQIQAQNVVALLETMELYGANIPREKMLADFESLISALDALKKELDERQTHKSIL